MSSEPWSAAGPLALASAQGAPGEDRWLASGLALVALVLVVLAAAALAVSRQARRAGRSPNAPREPRPPLLPVGDPRRSPRHAAWLPGPASGSPTDGSVDGDPAERALAALDLTDPDPGFDDVPAGDFGLSGLVRRDDAGRPQLRRPRPGAVQAAHLVETARGWAAAADDADPSALLYGLGELQRSWPSTTGSTAVAERRFRCDASTIERDLATGSLSASAAVDAAVAVLTAVDAYWSERDLLPRGCAGQLREAVRAAAAAARTGHLDPARRLADALAEHWSQYRLDEEVDEVLGLCVLRVQSTWSGPAGAVRVLPARDDRSAPRPVRGPASGSRSRADLLAACVADLFVAREDIAQDQATRLRWRFAALGFP